jgi:hypothetical protein
MKDARFQKISTTRLFATSGTVLVGALALMLGAASVSFADDIDRDTDLPFTAPVYQGPSKPAPPKAPPAPTPPVPVASEPAPTFFSHDIPASASIVYVIDQSGSMSIGVGDFTDQNGKIVANGSRMDRAKAELIKSIATLPKSFTFNVLFYDECVRPWQNANVAADDSHKTQSYAFITAQQPMGFTNTGLAVATACGDKTVKNVVLLSDGEPNFLDCNMCYVGTYAEHRSVIRQANSQHARVDCFGIGVASNPDARSFMQAVAEDNAGAYIEIN